MRISVPILAFVFLSAAWSPPSAAAQDRAYAPSLSRAELARSEAPDLLSALTELRPSWLTGSVVVYLDGRHLGDLPVLSTLHPEAVAGVRLVSEDYVQRTDPRYPRTPFSSAIWVSSRSGRDLTGRHATRTITVYGVVPAYGMHAALAGALADAGYPRESEVSEGVSYKVPSKAPGYSPGLGVNASIALTQDFGFELQGEHVFASSLGRFATDSRPAVGATFSYTDATLLATYRRWPARFAGGAIVRRARWKWVETNCGCMFRESSSSSGYGLAASAGTVLVVRHIAAVEGRVGARYFFSHEVPGYRSVPALDLSGPEVVLSIGIGLHR